MLRAAIDLFNRKGYDATSIGDVAEELGVTKSAVYHHVPSKEHLLSEALDEALAGLEAVDRRGGEADGSALRPAARRWSDAASRCSSTTSRRSPCCCGCTATPRSRTRPCAGAGGSTPGSPSSSARPRAEGALRADLDPDLVSRLLFGMINSLVEWYRPAGPVAARRRLADAVTAFAFDGLQA